jgi:hypothetical protein
LFYEPAGFGYQTQALLALGSGGLFGVGLGQSRQKFNYLPEPVTDSFFAVLGEEMGLIGTVVVVSLFLFVAWRGLRIAAYAPDEFGRLLAVGIVSWIVFQALINISAITGLIPLTGIPLPFISSGTSLAVYWQRWESCLIWQAFYTKEVKRCAVRFRVTDFLLLYSLMSLPRAVLSGGISGGHIAVNCGSAALRERYPRGIEFLFIGSQGQFESQSMADEGIPPNILTGKMRRYFLENHLTFSAYWYTSSIVETFLYMPTWCFQRVRRYRW